MSNEWQLILGIIIIPIIGIIGLAIFTIGDITSLFFGGIFLYFVLFVGSGFLIFIGLMIAPIHPTWGRYLSYGGVVGIMVLLLMIESAIVGISISDFKNKYKENIWLDCSSNNILSYVSCNIIGFNPLPKNHQDAIGWLNVFGFSIFGLVIPLMILVALFSDFVQSSGVVQNPTYQKIIGFGLGFMAYRGFIITRLIYILDIGSTGIAIIALNFIWLGGILGYIRKSFRQWSILEAEEELAHSIPAKANYLKNTAKKWVNRQQIAADFSDPIFLRDLSLVVGAKTTQELMEQSSVQDVNNFKDNFIRKINEAMT